MKLGLRARLFVLALGVVVVAAVLVNVEVRAAVEAHLMSNLEREVAGGTTDDADPWPAGSGRPAVGGADAELDGLGWWSNVAG